MAPKAISEMDLEQFSTRNLKKCLPKEASIFSAEIYAINLALDLISTSSCKKFIIHSDSISVLQSLKYTKLENPLIVKIFNKLNSLIHSKKVIFCWIPSHIRIQGNDKADSLAKAAINITPDKNIKTPYTDLKPKIKQIVTKKWQQLWDENPLNKLFQIQPIFKERKLEPNNTTREETTLTRLRIGHTQLTHSFILKEEPPTKMSLWKPILNQAHFDRIHKTQPHQEKVLYGKQHEGTI